MKNGFMTGDVEACLWTLVYVGSLVVAVGKLPAVSKVIVKVGSGITKFLEASATANGRSIGSRRSSAGSGRSAGPRFEPACR